MSESTSSVASAVGLLPDQRDVEGHQGIFVANVNDDKAPAHTFVAAENEFGSASVTSTKIWKLYESAADKHDTELARMWRGQTDAMLIFVHALARSYIPSFQILKASLTLTPRSFSRFQQRHRPRHHRSAPHTARRAIPAERRHIFYPVRWPRTGCLQALGCAGGVLVWQVAPAAFNGWNTGVSQRKVCQVIWHPTAQHVLTSTVGDHTVELWDLCAPEAPRAVLAGPVDTIQSLVFNPTGQLLRVATTSHDRKLHLFNPHAGGDTICVGEGHECTKSACVVWMGDHDRIATGFSWMSDRQVGVWETGVLKNLKMITLDQSAGRDAVLEAMESWKYRCFEYESNTLHALDEHKLSDLQHGMRFILHRMVSTPECEIARTYKLTTSAIELIAFIVPHKSDSFQSDIFLPVPSIEPSLTAVSTAAPTTSASYFPPPTRTQMMLFTLKPGPKPEPCLSHQSGLGSKILVMFLWCFLKFYHRLWVLQHAYTSLGLPVIVEIDLMYPAK
ncbi:hypothetical protein BC826DRAFT_973608 [Russula brevipes]|nr:hypothetical protein BC826DRAFT_973608 [Russula brevipes]